MKPWNIAIFLFVGVMSWHLFADKLKLITVLYNETHPQRLQEYKTCLDRNLAHSSIDAIHIIYDTVKDDHKNELHEYLKKQHSITISYIKGRPSFMHCFQEANVRFPNSKVILSNADIYFNNTLVILEDYDLSGKFFAITRKNIQRNGVLAPWPNAYYERPEPSQDVWIFSTPISLNMRNDIYFGSLHCEGELAYQVHSNGLEIINPYFSIDCCHLHLSGIRHWINRPYPSVPVYIPLMTKLPPIKKDNA